MTLYTVHLYREIRLTFEEIEAKSPEAAVAIARDGYTSDADDTDDCGGEEFAAVVDVVGDDEFKQSRTFEYEAARLRKSARAMLAALQEVTPLLAACARNATRLVQYQFAAKLQTIRTVCRDAISDATSSSTPQIERTHHHE